MIKYTLFTLFFLLFTFSSCTEKKEVLTLEHVKVSKLQLEETPFDIPSLFPKGCCIKDSFLVIFDPYLWIL